MRRSHMDMLKHQRDDTVHGGIRGAKVSLKACVECHASRETRSVAAARTDFCVSCHSYAAVKIDCFECHASRPARREAGGRLEATPSERAATAFAAAGFARRCEPARLSGRRGGRACRRDAGARHPLIEIAQARRTARAGRQSAVRWGMLIDTTNARPAAPTA